jgi:hypothetical protein
MQIPALLFRIKSIRFIDVGNGFSDETTALIFFSGCLCALTKFVKRSRPGRASNFRSGFGQRLLKYQSALKGLKKRFS